MINAVLNDAHVMAWLAWLERLEAQLWTLDEFDSHVTDWLAQQPKTHEQKQYEDAFVVFDETVELLEQRKRFDDNKKSYAPLEAEAADRLIAKLDEKVGTLYQSIGLGPDGKTLSAPVAADEIDLDMVTTRKELIDTFGKFTGMSLGWFDNLNDSPKLKAARKYTGQGGRHSAEPLFCPYEVMQWLADPKRKKGRKLGNEKAWQLLKAHFPKAYAPNSIGDPNAD